MTKGEGWRTKEGKELYRILIKKTEYIPSTFIVRYLSFGYCDLIENCFLT